MVSSLQVGFNSFFNTEVEYIFLGHRSLICIFIFVNKLERRSLNFSLIRRRVEL